MRMALVVTLVAVSFVMPLRAEDKPVAVSEVIRKTDHEKYTPAEIKEFHDSVKGLQAEGMGRVVEVIPGLKNRHKVTVLTDASAPGKGYNVVLYTTMNAPLELKKNDRIRFRGEIGRISDIDGSSVDIHGTYEQLK